MCGITGIISRDPIQQTEVDLVARMNQLLAHRGPDGAGEFRDQHIALAMRRLSIIDLTTGWQPLYNEDRSLALICNGEIYNFVELRRELEARGHRFATHSDCETILHLYEERGEKCVEHLRGMFAFALWDAKKRRLLLARDRMGEKPLYLADSPNRIIFASELKALVRSGAVPFELDPASIKLYLHYNYVPEPLAAIKGVRKLPAAHTLTIDLDEWKVQQRCYWRMEDAPLIEGDPAEVVRSELERIGDLIIRSDVPVGIALSGGMDSSAIACLTAKRYPGTMQAISIGYPGRPYQDERADAKELAHYLGLPIHEVELSTDEMLRSLPQISFERDDPIGDLSGSSYYFVLKRARELGVPVMLSGHGGDELFWGYGWVRDAVHACERKAALLRNGSVGLRDYLKVTRPPYSYNAGMRWLRSLGGVLEGVNQYQRDRRGPRNRLVFYDLEPSFRTANDEMHDLVTPRFLDESRHIDPERLFTIDQPWPAPDITITRLICETYMIENGLAQGDRLSMASSVELRLPLVDYRLVETVIGLRKAQRDIDLGPKRWLREAVKDIVPEFVMKRRKRGFTPPWREWAHGLSAMYGDQLADGYLVQHEVLTRQGARRLANRLAPSRFGTLRPMNDRVLVLELWCRGMSRALNSVDTLSPSPMNLSRSLQSA